MKKTTILTALIMLMAVFTAQSQTATAPTIGDGTSGNPYQIATLDNLYWLTQSDTAWDKNYIQTADINAAETNTWNISGTDTLGFSPIGNSTTSFTGSYNGQGHIIDRLFINRPSTNWIGLFGYSEGASFDSLGVINVNITAYTKAGALCGHNKSSSSIKNSYSSGNISGHSELGGLVGLIESSSFVNNSYSTVNVTSDDQVGGLVGLNWGGIVNNSYSTGYVSGNTNTGGLVGKDGVGATVTNSFWDTQTSGQATSVGGTGKTTVEMQTLTTYTDNTWDFVGETANGTDDYWDIRVCLNDDYPYLSWQNLSFTPNGSGIAANPYQIATLCDLRWLSETDTVWDKHFIQTADINAAETNTWDISGSDTLGFSPIGNSTTNFTGSYNGQGHTIDSLFIDRSSTNYVGLFGYVNNGEIDSLGLTNVQITGNDYVGSIIGVLINNNINYIFSTGTVSGNVRVGGIIGDNNGVITNSYSSCSITANRYAGGLAGTNRHIIQNSYATGNVNASLYYAGGLIGAAESNFVINNCYSTGDIYCTRYIGGLAGQVYEGSINNCYSTSLISGTTDVGGFIGKNSNNTVNVTNCFWDTLTSGQSTSEGGTGLTTVEMQQMCIYADSTWDFMIETVNGTNDIWGLNTNENGGYPFLSWQGFAHTEECCGYVDLTNPTLTTQNTTLYLDASGSAILNSADIVTSASDNCAIADTTLSQTNFSCSDIGTPVSVDVTLTDITGNFVTNQATITVEDNINPTITCVGNQTVAAASNHYYTVVGNEFNPTANNDNCGVASIVNNYNNTNTLTGDSIPEGTTTITWIVTDNSGNVDSCTFDIIVDIYVGISTISENGINIYPNPAHDFIIIKNSKSKIKNLEILDITGKSIKQFKINNSKLTIQVEDLKQGIYFIKLTTNKTTEVLKLIKK